MSCFRGLFSLCKKPKDHSRPYKQYRDLGYSFKRDGKWTEAGEAFFKAAEIAENKLIKPVQALSYYDASAECYLKGLSPQAYYYSCRKSIEVCLEKRWIIPAHQRCVYSGYIFEKEFEDVVKSKEFYNLADELYPDLDTIHRCCFTPDFMVEFCQQLWSVCKNSHDNIDFLKSEKMNKARQSLRCTKCMLYRDIHNKFYWEIFDLGESETIDYIKKTYDTFTAELCRTTDSSNKFYAESKKEIIEEIERIKNDN